MASVIMRANYPGRALPVSTPRPNSERPACRRIFFNAQLLERFDQWLQICGKSPHTRSNYIEAGKQFAKYLADKSFAAVTTADIRGFLGQLYSRNLQSSTMAGRLSALRSLFHFLELGDQVRTSAPRYIQTRKLPVRLPHAKSEEEIERLINAAETPRDRAILEMLYASGLRVSELAHLRVEDVSLNARSLVVRKGKGGKDRIGLFGTKAAEALAAYLGDRQTGPLFVRERRKQRGGGTRDSDGAWWGQWREESTDGKRVMRSVCLGDYELPTKERARQALNAFLKNKLPASRQEGVGVGLVSRSIYRIVVLAAKRAGITGISPHTLRHSCATHLLNRGVDIRFVQELLGHCNLGATQKYLHVAIERLQKVHELLERG